MGPILRQIILFSSSPLRLARFLSGIFELNYVRSSGQGTFRLSGEDLHFLIMGHQHESAHFHQNMMLNFSLEKEDFENLHQKIQFQIYLSKSVGSGDLEMAGHDFSIGEVKNCSHGQFFFFTDNDGRRWKFDGFNAALEE